MCDHSKESIALKLNTRIEWINYAKVILMLFVILDHLGPRDRMLSSWIWSFHLPAFFFISGIFSKTKPDPVDYVLSNAYRLLVPIILWHFIGMFVWQPIMIYHMYPSSFWREYGLFQLDFLLGNQINMGWFLLVLFWCRIVFFVFVRFPRWLQSLFAFIISPIIAYYLETKGIKLPYYLSHFFMVFPVYYLGVVCNKIVINYRQSRLLTMLIMIVCLVFSIVLTSTEQHPSFYAFDFGLGIFYTYVQSIVGTIFILSVSYLLYELIGHYNILAILGDGTVILLLFQTPFLLLSNILYRQIFDCTDKGPYYDTLSAFIASILIMVAMYPIIIFINKYMPILAGKKVKNK